MLTRKPNPNTRNRSASLWSKSTATWAALCLAFALSPSSAAAMDLLYHGPEAELVEARGHLLAPGPAATSEPVVVATPTVGAGLAQSHCAPIISSGPNDPPAIGYLVSEEWDAARGVWVGTYLTSSLQWVEKDCRS